MRIIHRLTMNTVRHKDIIKLLLPLNLDFKIVDSPLGKSKSYILDIEETHERWKNVEELIKN